MRALKMKGALWFLCGLFMVALAPATAQANRALLTEKALKTDLVKTLPPPEGQIEGACGAAISGGKIYVSDYYHLSVESWGLGASLPLEFSGQISAGTFLEGPCQLAIDSKGAIYANLWHESVVRLQPSFQLFDAESSTGVAVDSEGNVYVNDRTHAVVYDSSGTQIKEIGGPGVLIDAYGIAVFAGRVYVPDAATDTIKVFEPTVSTLVPAFAINGNGTPQHGFNSLVDASVAVDPTNGHLLVLDNLQPGFEHPKAAIDEFDSNGAFLGQLKHTVIDGEPSGLVVEPGTGRLFATSGNSEEANAFAFGPYTESGPEAKEGALEIDEPSVASQRSAGVGAAVALAPPTGTGPASATRAAKRRAAARRHARRHRAQVRSHLVAPPAIPRTASGRARWW